MKHLFSTNDIQSDYDFPVIDVSNDMDNPGNSDYYPDYPDWDEINDPEPDPDLG